MLAIYIPAVLILLCYVLFYYFTRNFNYWKKRNVPGPPPVAFFGNIKETALRQKNFAVTLQEAYNMFPNDKVVGIYTMTTPCLLLRDLDVIKSILVKDFNLFKDRGLNFSKDGLGKNLFHADSETWSVLRSRFNTIFTPGKLRNMFPLFLERANVFMDEMDNITQTTDEHDIRLLLQKFTISTIFACAFGIDTKLFTPEEFEVLKTIDRISLTPTFALEVDMMYPGIMEKLNLSIFPASVSKFFDKLVATVISQRNGKPSGRGDLMDLILSMRQMGEVSGLKYMPGNEKRSIEITDEIIAAQAFVFYFGGYETSATTMTYLLHHLALQPKIQNRLREEVDNVIKTYGEISYESLSDMKYLDKIFSETLRLHPIADPLQRRAEVDYKLPSTDIVIRKNQLVYISVRGVQHDAKHYPKPEMFDPERFDSEVVRSRHPCAFLTFGAGPRNCIGMRFGALQSRLCIAKLISKYRFETKDETQNLEVHPNRLVVGPKDPIMLKIVPRER